MIAWDERSGERVSTKLYIRDGKNIMALDKTMANIDDENRIKERRHEAARRSVATTLGEER